MRNQAIIRKKALQNNEDPFEFRSMNELYRVNIGGELVKEEVTEWFLKGLIEVVNFHTFKSSSREYVSCDVRLKTSKPEQHVVIHQNCYISNGNSHYLMAVKTDKALSDLILVSQKKKMFQSQAFNQLLEDMQIKLTMERFFSLMLSCASISGYQEKTTLLIELYEKLKDWKEPPVLVVQPTAPTVVNNARGKKKKKNNGNNNTNNQQHQQQNQDDNSPAKCITFNPVGTDDSDSDDPKDDEPQKELLEWASGSQVGSMECDQLLSILFKYPLISECQFYLLCGLYEMAKTACCKRGDGSRKLTAFVNLYENVVKNNCEQTVQTLYFRNKGKNFKYERVDRLQLTFKKQDHPKETFKLLCYTEKTIYYRKYRLTLIDDTTGMQHVVADTFEGDKSTFHAALSTLSDWMGMYLTKKQDATFYCAFLVHMSWMSEQGIIFQLQLL